MPVETLGRSGEAQEKAGEGRKLTPVGIDRLQTPDGTVQIIRAKDANGGDVAVVLGVDQTQLELILGDDNPGREGGALSRFARNLVVRFAGGVAGLAGAALGLANCGGTSDNYSGKGDSTYSTHSGALTTTQMMGNIQGQPAPWTDWGDSPGNFAEMEGKKYILFGNNYAPDPITGKKAVFYIECDQLSQCFDATATRQAVEGLKEAGLAGPYTSAGIYKDKNGKSKFLVDSAYDWIYEGDISKNPTTGKLKVENLNLVDPPMDGSFSIHMDNGIPHIVYGQDKFILDRDLHSGAEKLLPEATFSTYDTCGVPALDGQLAIGSKLSTISGVKHCNLVMAASLEDLATKAAAIVSLNSQATGAVKRLGNPRLVTDTDGSGILIYSSTNGTPGNIGGNPLTEVWYALIPKPVSPVEPDATGDTDTPDAGPLPDTPTVTDNGPEAPDVEVIPDPGLPPEDVAVVDDTAEVSAEDIADAIASEVESAKDALEDSGIDPGDLQEIFDAAEDAEAAAPDADPPPEDVPETEPDTPPPLPDVPKTDTPDTTPPTACDFAKGKISVKIGDCPLENCTEPLVDLKGKCTVEIDLGQAKPVTLEIDGSYQIDLLENLGALLSGQFNVIDNGNNFGTVMGNFTTAVEGTIYSGKLPDSTNYQISCTEGKVIVYWSDKEGKKHLLATLTGGQTQGFEIANPMPEPKPEPKPQPEPTNNTDTSTTSPEVATPAPTPPKTSGCDSSNTPSDANHLSIVGLALLALASLWRRRRQGIHK